MEQPTAKDSAMLQDTEGMPDDKVLDLAAELVRRDRAKAATAEKAQPAEAPASFDAALPEGSLRLPVAPRTAERLKRRQDLIASYQRQIENEQRAIDDIAGTVKDAAGADGNFVLVGIYEPDKGKPILQLVPVDKLEQLQQNLAASQRAG